MLGWRKLTPTLLTRDTPHSATGGETTGTTHGINPHPLTFSPHPLTSHSPLTPSPSPPLTPSLLYSQVPVTFQSVQHMETVCGHHKTGTNHPGTCPSAFSAALAPLHISSPSHPSPGAGLHHPLSSPCPPQTEEASAHTRHDRAA